MMIIKCQICGYEDYNWRLPKDVKKGAQLPKLYICDTHVKKR